MTFIGVSLEDVHEDLADLVREFAQREIEPRAAAWNAAHHVPVELVRQLGELGLIGVTIPEEDGGGGLDAVALALVIEELARADAGVSVMIAVQAGLVASPIRAFGTREQRAHWLPDLCAGRVIGGYGLTEPDAGSDVAAVRTQATADGDGWRLGGAKTWITNGGIADVVLVFARTGLGSHGLSAFLVTPADGLRAGPEIPKLGLHTSSTTEILLDEVRVGPEALLGSAGDGMGIALSTLDGGRVTIAAQACGIAGAALELAIRYAKERRAFGGPIARHQGVQFPIADIAARLAAARLLMLHAASLRAAGAPHALAGAQAKLLASRVAVDAADMAVQTLGGYGYSSEFPAERYYRDAKITELYEGTSQIQRVVIARHLLGEAARG